MEARLSGLSPDRAKEIISVGSSLSIKKFLGWEIKSVDATASVLRSNFRRKYFSNTSPIYAEVPAPINRIRKFLKRNAFSKKEVNSLLSEDIVE